MAVKHDINLRAPPSANLQELDDVRLVADVDTDDGRLPVGSIGTVVHAYQSGHLFEVEFSMPFSAVVTLRHSQIIGLR